MMKSFKIFTSLSITVTKNIIMAHAKPNKRSIISFLKIFLLCKHKKQLSIRKSISTIQMRDSVIQVDTSL